MNSSVMYLRLSFVKPWKLPLLTNTAINTCHQQHPYVYQSINRSHRFTFEPSPIRYHNPIALLELFGLPGCHKRDSRRLDLQVTARSPVTSLLRLHVAGIVSTASGQYVLTLRRGQPREAKTGGGP